MAQPADHSAIVQAIEGTYGKHSDAVSEALPHLVTHSRSLLAGLLAAQRAVAAAGLLPQTRSALTHRALMYPTMTRFASSKVSCSDYCRAFDWAGVTPSARADAAVEWLVADAFEQDMCAMLQACGPAP